MPATPKCPARTITDQSRRLLELFPMHQAGHLYVAGGTRDQPALYVAAMDLLTAYHMAPGED